MHIFCLLGGELEKYAVVNVNHTGSERVRHRRDVQTVVDIAHRVARASLEAKVRELPGGERSFFENGTKNNKDCMSINQPTKQSNKQLVQINAQECAPKRDHKNTSEKVGDHKERRQTTLKENQSKV